MVEIQLKDPTAKLGITIQRPSGVKINAVYPFLLFLSFVLLGFTAWLLMLEYVAEPLPIWLREVTENLSLVV